MLPTQRLGCTRGPRTVRDPRCKTVFGWFLLTFWILAPVNSLRSVEPDDAALQQALATIVAAQPGGETQPAEAWQVVAEASYEQLPLVLQAMDEADALAANWISMALDRIVERQGTGDLPLDILSRAALDTQHALLTRKMSLELLSRANVEMVDRLQAQLMNDPEAELRRPAVEAEIARASEMAAQFKNAGQGEREATSQQELVDTWLDVLAAARDQDQVLRIARELKGLDYEVDLGAQFGYLVDWYVVGPFDNTGGQGYDTAYPPEQLTLESFERIAAGTAEPVEGRSGLVRWKKVQAKAANGDVNLNEGIEKLRDVLAYGATVFQSDRAQQVDVRLRIQNSFKIWLNGRPLVEQPVGHTGNSFDQYRVRADMRRGKNLLVVKSCQVDLQGATQFYDNWHFCVRICDATGGAILAADRESLSRPDSTDEGADQ